MRVFIGILSTGDVSAKLALSLCKMINNPSYTVELTFVGAKRVEASRSIVTKKFLESECEYLLMIDEDNPPTRNPLELLKEDKDIIVFPTPIFYNNKISWNIDIGQNKQMSGFQKINTGGTGCILIKRSVLENIKFPFDTIVDEFGVTKEGVDIRFCRLAKEAGFKIWTHWSYPCEHFKKINLLDLLG